MWHNSIKLRPRWRSVLAELILFTTDAYTHTIVAHTHTHNRDAHTHTILMHTHTHHRDAHTHTHQRDAHTHICTPAWCLIISHYVCLLVAKLADDIALSALIRNSDDCVRSDKWSQLFIMTTSPSFKMWWLIQRNTNKLWSWIRQSSTASLWWIRHSSTVSYWWIRQSSTVK